MYPDLKADPFFVPFFPLHLFRSLSVPPFPSPRLPPPCPHPRVLQPRCLLNNVIAQFMRQSGLIEVRTIEGDGEDGRVGRGLLVSAEERRRAGPGWNATKIGELLLNLKSREQTAGMVRLILLNWRRACRGDISTMGSKAKGGQAAWHDDANPIISHHLRLSYIVPVCPSDHMDACTEVCGKHLNSLPWERGFREAGMWILRAERKGLPPHFSWARPCLVSSCFSLPTPSPSLPMTAFFCYLSPRRGSFSSSSSSQLVSSSSLQK